MGQSVGSPGAMLLPGLSDLCVCMGLLLGLLAMAEELGAVWLSVLECFCS